MSRLRRLNLNVARGAVDPPLFAAKGDHDLFVAASENYPAIFDSLDHDLIDLRADLEAKLLAFGHRFAVDDRETSSAVERDGADEKCARRNFTLISSARRNFSGRFPANRPKWTSRSRIDIE